MCVCVCVCVHVCACVHARVHFLLRSAGGHTHRQVTDGAGAALSQRCRAVQHDLRASAYMSTRTVLFQAVSKEKAMLA